MSVLFELFVREKTYLKGLTPKTTKHYLHSYQTFLKFKGELTEDGIKNFVMNMVESGMKPSAANAYSRSINSFLSWMYENKKLEIHLQAPLLKVEKRVLKTFKLEDVQKIVSCPCYSFGDKRMHAILCTLIDTGARITEALTLKREGVDFDNLLLTISGKGRKERKVPMSRELRKILYRWLKSHTYDLVFCTRNGDQLRYDNMRRDFNLLLEKAGVKKTEGSFHAFRRYFAKQYVRNGGNLFYLQKTLGHSTLEITKQYVEVEDEELSMAHKSASPLERLKSA